MNSRDRLLAVVNSEEPDFPSLGECIINPPVFNKILGKETAVWNLFSSVKEAVQLVNKEYLLNPFGLFVTPEDFVRGHEKVGLDWISIHSGLPEAETKIRAGARTEIRPDVETIWYVGGSLKTGEDLESLRDMDPYDPGRVFNRVNRRALRLAHDKNMAVLGGIGGSFQSSIDTCGYDSFLINVFRQPDFIKEVLDLFSRFNAEIGKQFVDLGCDVILIYDDMCNRKGPHMSPKHFREMVFPFLKRQIQEIQRKGVKVILHCCGNTSLILDDLVNYVGIEGYHAIEPMAGMDIGLVKEKYGDKISLFGNVDCSHTLCLKTFEEVKNETIEVIEKAAYGGGLNVNSSNSIHNAVKLENFQAMIKTVHKYGRYAYR